MHAIDSESQDQNFVKLLNSIDMDKYEQNGFVDKQHPTDKNRSVIKDAQSRLETYFARKERQTGQEIWHTGEVAGIRKQIRDEYFPRPKKPTSEEGEEVTDTKAEEKFEPFYEGEGKDSAPASEAPSEPIIEETQSQQTSSH